MTADNGTPAPRLLCLPYAGGSGVAYRHWSSAFPRNEVVAFDYPGHLMRPGERLARTMDALVGRIEESVSAHWDRPFVLVGSSLGALVAYELASRAEQRGTPPAALVVLACPGPGRLWKHPPIAGLDDERFSAAFGTRYGGPAAGLLGDPDHRELLLPIVRADMELFEEYAGGRHEAVGCDVIAVTGTEDAAAPGEDVDAWHDHTSGAVHVLNVPGGHFVVEEPGRFAGALSSLLDGRPAAPLLGPAATPSPSPDPRTPR
ncbi:thioesterase II family protein [Actinacidiphila reveromycinica]|nr:alpha/beta fold hydrolase [Streptomyces sp. SN-593]